MKDVLCDINVQPLKKEEAQRRIEDYLKTLEGHQRIAKRSAPTEGALADQEEFWI